MEDLEKKIEQLYRYTWNTAHKTAEEFYDKKTLSHVMEVMDRVSWMDPHRNKTCGYDYEPTDIDVFWNKAVVVAMLHDILEDTACTPELLLERGIDEDIVSAVRMLTRPKEQHDYFDDYITRVKKNELCRVVKISDLEHNMDVRRLEKFGDYEQKRLRKYWYSWRFLRGDISETEAHNELHPDNLYR